MRQILHLDDFTESLFFASRRGMGEGIYYRGRASGDEGGSDIKTKGVCFPILFAGKNHEGNRPDDGD